MQWLCQEYPIIRSQGITHAGRQNIELRPVHKHCMLVTLDSTRSNKQLEVGWFGVLVSFVEIAIVNAHKGVYLKACKSGSVKGSVASK